MEEALHRLWMCCRMIQKLCHLIASREHGGLEKHVADLSSWQARNTAAQITVIGHPRYQSTLNENVHFIPLNTDRSRHHPNLVWRLANQIRQGSFQITHGHGSKSAQLLAAVKPYTDALQVITRHNVRHPRDKLASTFDARIAISKSTVANSKLDWHIIPNGVPLPQPVANPHALAHTTGNRPTLLAASRLIKARGIDILIEAMTLVPDAQLLVVGDGPEKSALQQQAQALHLRDRVTFFSADNAITRFLQASDLVVIPARTEGTPYTLIEALLHRRPVIASDTGNAGEYLPEGYLLEELGVSAIAEKIQMALAAPNKVQRDFTAVFDRAAEELTLDSMAQATWRVYRQLIA